MLTSTRGTNTRLLLRHCRSGAENPTVAEPPQLAASASSSASRSASRAARSASRAACRASRSASRAARRAASSSRVIADTSGTNTTAAVPTSKTAKTPPVNSACPAFRQLAEPDPPNPYIVSTLRIKKSRARREVWISFSVPMLLKQLEYLCAQLVEEHRRLLTRQQKHA